MPMSKWIALLLPSVAQSLALSRETAITDNAQRNEGLCDAEALYKAHQTKDWRALRNSPCMDEHTYEQLVTGVRDPDDNSEFLGDDRMAELVDVIPSPVKVSKNKRAVGNPTMLPKLQLIGAPTSGTTTLAVQMNLHPQLSFGLTKEHKMVFNIGKTSNAKIREAYKSTFPLQNLSTLDETHTKITFDASPDTVWIGCPDDVKMKEFPIGKKYGTGVRAVNQVHGFLGHDTKYIVMLRDPLDWQVSDAHEGGGNVADIGHYFPGNGTSGSMDSKRSCYVDCLEAWVQVAGRGNFLFLQSEEYFKDSQAALTKIFKFVGVDHRRYTKEELGAAFGRRRSNKKFQVPTSDRKLYWEDSHVKECKSRLQKLTGRGWHWGP